LVQTINSLKVIDMATVKGPLMSMEASGAYGGTLVFGRRLGSNVVRQLVTPANPQTQGQQDARNRVRVFGALQSFFNNTALVLSGQTDTDKVRLGVVTPAGQRWNSYLQQLGIGTGGTTYTAARAAYGALTEPQKSAWDTAAGNLTPSITSVAQKDAGGADATPLTAGEVWFIGQYALSRVSLTTVPGATPPTYA
jgi:hypothetical protein